MYWNLCYTMLYIKETRSTMLELTFQERIIKHLLRPVPERNNDDALTTKFHYLILIPLTEKKQNPTRLQNVYKT